MEEDTDMKREPRGLDQDRRRFLRDLAVASGVATAAWVPGRTAAAGTTGLQPAAPRSGYRLTAHVRKYYQKARF